MIVNYKKAPFKSYRLVTAIPPFPSMFSRSFYIIVKHWLISIGRKKKTLEINSYNVYKERPEKMLTTYKDQKKC